MIPIVVVLLVGIGAVIICICRERLQKSFSPPTVNEPGHEKTYLRGFRPGKTQTGFLSYRDHLESWNFGFSKYRYYTIKSANNKGAEQTARMRRLICAFVVRIWQNGFSHDGAQIFINLSTFCHIIVPNPFPVKMVIKIHLMPSQKMAMIFDIFST